MANQDTKKLIGNIMIGSGLVLCLIGAAFYLFIPNRNPPFFALVFCAAGGVELLTGLVFKTMGARRE